MSESSIKIDTLKWVNRARADEETHRQRQVTDIILHAIARVLELNEKLCLKGGVLMGLAYDSPRQTSDIDFSFATAARPDKNTADTFRNLLNTALPHASAKLGYPDLVVRVQSVEGLPANRYPDADFPALKLKIAYAKRGSPQEIMLGEGTASNTISLDISFNEKISKVQLLETDQGEILKAYSLNDLIAEKYRAILQQSIRNRYRRQDVYDLDILIRNPDLNDEAKAMILTTFIEKCELRNIKPTQDSIDVPEIKKRSGSEWSTLELEIGNVPDFDACFERVATFYRQLPWPPGRE